jgi:predicted ABC-type ATPase
VAPSLLEEIFHIETFVNADTIAQGLSGLNPKSAALAAGRITLQRLKVLADKQASFAFETTLASRSFAPFLRRLSSYDTTLLFLFLRTPELAIKRVASRVQAGGHSVPDSTIRRRYVAGLNNLFKLYLSIVNNWAIWDASFLGEPQLVAARAENDRLEIGDAALWRLLEETYGTT